MLPDRSIELMAFSHHSQLGGQRSPNQRKLDCSIAVGIGIGIGIGIEGAGPIQERYRYRPRPRPQPKKSARWRGWEQIVPTSEVRTPSGTQKNRSCRSNPRIAHGPMGGRGSRMAVSSSAFTWRQLRCLSGSCSMIGPSLRHGSYIRAWRKHGGSTEQLRKTRIKPLLSR